MGRVQLRIPLARHHARVESRSHLARPPSSGRCSSEPPGVSKCENRPRPWLCAGAVWTFSVAWRLRLATWRKSEKHKTKSWLPGHAVNPERHGAVSLVRNASHALNCSLTSDEYENHRYG